MSDEREFNQIELSQSNLEEVSGGAILYETSTSSRPIPVEVRDGENRSAFCPYCPDTVLDYAKTEWDPLWCTKVHSFKCPACGKDFIKCENDNQWFYLPNNYKPFNPKG